MSDIVENDMTAPEITGDAEAQIVEILRDDLPLAIEHRMGAACLITRLRADQAIGARWKAEALAARALFTSRGGEVIESPEATLLDSLRAELAAAEERAATLERERDSICDKAVEKTLALDAAEAKAEGLAKALETEREAIAEYVDRNLMSCRDYAAAIRSRAQESETGAVSTAG